MKQIKWMLLLVVGMFVAASCQKDEEVGVNEIDIDKLTSYIWKGEEYSGWYSGYVTNSKVSYNFLKDSTFKKTLVNSIDTVYQYEGKWTIVNNNEIHLTYSDGIPDHSRLTEVLKVVELSDREFSFKRLNDAANMATVERKYQSTTKINQNND